MESHNLFTPKSIESKFLTTSYIELFFFLVHKLHKLYTTINTYFRVSTFIKLNDFDKAIEKCVLNDFDLRSQLVINCDLLS